MRMIIGDRSEWVCRWTAEQLGDPSLFKNNAYGIAIVHRDQVVAGVVYHDWSETNTFISIATTSPAWCSRLTLKAIFGYAFNQMQVNGVSIIIRGGNRKWRKDLINRYGFTPKCKLEGWFKDCDGYLLRMMRAECKWIEDHGQRIERQQRAAV